MDNQIPMTIAGREYRREVAEVTSSWLGWEDHGIFSVCITFDYGGATQGFGHMKAGLPLIKVILRALGCEKWEDIGGQKVWVVREPGHNGSIRGICPLFGSENGFVLGKDGKFIDMEGKVVREEA